MKLYIKNMVSNRCKRIVKSELEFFGLYSATVKLGEIEIKEMVSEEQLSALSGLLANSGFSLLSEKNNILVERIKTIIIDLVHYSGKQLAVNISEYLSIKLKYSYNDMARIFSKHQGMTIEQYLHSHTIEKAKELLIYKELNITEIADLLNYNSVHQLSNQFKKSTGLTPSQYKQLRLKQRKVIENVLTY